MECAHEEVPDAWRAAVLRSPGRPLDVIEVARPRLAAGQVLVRIRYSGVCRSQLMEVRGLRGPDRWVPHLLGHEGVGHVVEVGPEVNKVRVGERVIVGWISGEGAEAPPASYYSKNGERINGGRVTTFSEYSVISENRTYRAPAKLGDRTAVLFGCALLTGAGMALNEVHLNSEHQVLVNGAGGVGFAALLGALSRGCHSIVADPDQQKRELAIGLGADFAFDPLSTDEVSAFRSAYPDGVDVAFDSSGQARGIEFAFESLIREGGTLVFASHPPEGDMIRLDPHDLIRGRQIKGSWGGHSRPDADIDAISSLLDSRGVDLAFMTPRTYLLDEVNLALSDLEAGTAMRPLIEMRP